MFIAAASDPISDSAEVVQKSPIIIYVAIFCGVVYMLAAALPKIAALLGPIGRWIQGRADRQRRITIEQEDAEVTDLREDNDYLRTVSETRRVELTKRDRLAYKHQQWDQRMITRSSYPENDPPPELFPRPISGAQNPEEEEG